MGKFQLITKGLIKENPTFVLLLGMCPTLATTTSAINGMSMGLATTFVLILSNIVISAIAAYIPDKVRIPSYIVVIATFVTLLQFVMQAYVPDIYETLGLFIPLIVVNCIVLGRAEAFANKNGVVDSALDGIGIGLGFTLSLTVLGLVREILGSGSAFGWKFIEGDGILAFVLAPGAFLALGYLIVIFRKLTTKRQSNYGIYTYHHFSDIRKQYPSFTVPWCMPFPRCIQQTQHCDRYVDGGMLRDHSCYCRDLSSELASGEVRS